MGIDHLFESGFVESRIFVKLAYLYTSCFFNYDLLFSI